MEKVPQSAADWSFGFNYNNLRSQELMQVTYKASSLNGKAEWQKGNAGHDIK